MIVQPVVRRCCNLRFLSYLNSIHPGIGLHVKMSQCLNGLCSLSCKKVITDFYSASGVRFER